jgi:D-alanine-D-alanine ligase
MRIAVLHSAVPDDAPLEDQDTFVQVDAVVSSLNRLGHLPTVVPCTLDLAAMRDALRRWKPDVCFNLVESLGQADSLVYLPLAVLDVLGLPYTGGRTEALFLTTHKLLAKERLRQAGLPTPPWIDIAGNGLVLHREGREGPSACDGVRTCSSWILKGVWDQASRGMDDEAVVRGCDDAEIRRRVVERTAQSGRPCFAEQFIDGREFNLSLLTGPAGVEVLPPAEIDFSAFPPEKPRIVGHKAKWQADSFEYQHTPRGFEIQPADRRLAEELCRLACACWDLFGLRGWARVDFRVDAAGRPWILEINANPCLSPDAGFAAALAQASIPFDEAMGRIVAESVLSPALWEEQKKGASIHA